MRPLRLGPSLPLTSLLLTGCGGFRPQPFQPEPLRGRLQSWAQQWLRVSLVALTPEEGRAVGGFDLAGRGIQPVGVKVENREAVR